MRIAPERARAVLGPVSAGSGAVDHVCLADVVLGKDALAGVPSGEMSQCNINWKWIEEVGSRSEDEIPPLMFVLAIKAVSSEFIGASN